MKAGFIRAQARRAASLRRLAACAVCAAMIAGHAAGQAAHAKLPPPTPEQIAKAEADKEKAKLQIEQEQAALTRVQDRLATEYQSNLKKRGITPPTPTPVAPTEQANLPKTVKEPARGVGPRGGTTPSAEAHSGSAR